MAHTRAPGPDHPITTVANPNRVVVRLGEHVVADTTRAVSVDEAGHPLRDYIPREDIDMACLTRTDHTTHCPFKGDAAYYTIEADGHRRENAAWTYEAPPPTMDRIKGLICFDLGRNGDADVLPAGR